VIYNDPRDAMQADPRNSSRIRNKQLMQTSMRSFSSKESRAPKIIKSLSSSEKSKLASLHTPKKGSHKNDDSDDSKSISSSKILFCGYPDLSRGIEKLFELIKLHEDSMLLLTSMDLGNDRNMIQLSDQELHDVTSIFSRQDLRDSSFQDSIIKSYAMESVSNLTSRKYMA
jgi:hypothetical protein